MTMLSKYYVPGLAIEDHSIDVPLDWTGHEPGRAFDGETIKLFYRVVTTPEHVHDDLPLLIFLQGGPGGAGPRLNSPTSDGWIEEATKHFRVILPDQRGTGRSSRVDTHVMARIAAAHDDDAAAGARAQADYLKKFLADSIVRDFEHLRLTEFGGRKWVTMGQSYGGFLTLTTLSLFPAGVIASFTTGGSFEASGYGYGPGIGEGYDKLIMIVSRASGAPVIANALEYAAQLIRGKVFDVAKAEFARAEKAGLSKILAARKAAAKPAAEAETVTAPPAEPCTASIPGIEVMDLEDAVQALWKAGIYAESGMGCTGPLVMMSEANHEKALEILKKAGYVG